MIEKIVIELSKRLGLVKTLSTQREDRITKINDKGIYLETESSREKFQIGEKTEPFEFISYEYILEGWNEFINVRHAEANDFKKTRGRTSFLMALFAQLPFVEATLSGKTFISLREFQTDELPNVQFQNVTSFLDEVISSDYDPKKLMNIMMGIYIG